MKRSRMLYLGMLGTMGALAGCTEEQPAMVFNTLDECKASSITTPQVCQDGYDQALANHTKTAPRFTSIADCEQDFGPGKCQSLAGSGSDGVGSFFVPAFTGFMVARLLQNQNSGPYYSSSGYWGQPLYRTRSDSFGTWRTSDNATISGTGRVSVPSEVAHPATRAVTMSRSGFGSVSSARSSFSSSSSGRSSSSSGS